MKKLKLVAALAVAAMLQIPTVHAYNGVGQDTTRTTNKARAKQGVNEVGHGTKEVGKGTKNLAVSGAKATAKGAKKAGKAVKKTTKKGVEKVKGTDE
ncbi:hypothetical protein [Rufibacter ruber]|uniref:hypothetical protein n=1 Tax=Rufibacter ruber TaxID=1783499 RepID=UPI00083234FE|nr:hypothetical protein [Rufibacter ruber]